jgi:DNA-directed RNA polymerase subunit RPC12/RpoP
MPVRIRYRCGNCGERFEVEVLTPDEVREARRRDQPTRDVQCPKCRRTDVEKGW